MRRRDLLKVVPALALVGAGAAEAQTETPVIVLFREWKSAQEAEDAAYILGLPDEEAERIADTRHRIQVRLMAEPCRTAQDFICKVAAHSAFGAFDLPDEEQNPDLWAEARALIAA